MVSSQGGVRDEEPDVRDTYLSSILKGAGCTNSGPSVDGCGAKKHALMVTRRYCVRGVLQRQAVTVTAAPALCMNIINTVSVPYAYRTEAFAPFSTN